MTLGTTISRPAVFSRGDVVLVPFPFTNLQGRNKRPAVVVNIEEYQFRNTDILIAPITSQLQNQRYGDHVLSDWHGAGLLMPSLVRAKIATLRASMVERRLGQMLASDLSVIEGNLRMVLAL